MENDKGVGPHCCRSRDQRFLRRLSAGKERGRGVVAREGELSAPEFHINCPVVHLQFPLPHTRGSSHGQSRGIRKAYPDPFFTNIMEEAYKEWNSIEKQTGVKLIK